MLGFLFFCTSLKKAKNGKRAREGTDKNYKNNHKTSNKMVISTCQTIITLNVNELNAPIKRQRVAEWIKKQDAVYKRLTTDEKTHILNGKG